MKKIPVLTIVLLIIVGGGAFFGGMKYQQTKRSSFSQQAGTFQRQGRNIMGGNRAGFRPVSGEVISSDDKSITVKLQDGSTKIVLLSDKTQINRAETINKSELKNGEKVAVFGAENSDGSITAQNIQLNPIFKNANTTPSAQK
ncbi:MAG: DUF5666 domain-containing protein [Actinobacteria bacterium]|nr:DUF5666 domain-containing protein [Actinomycetota bacterium]